MPKEITVKFTFGETWEEGYSDIDDEFWIDDLLSCVRNDDVEWELVKSKRRNRNETVRL